MITAGLTLFGKSMHISPRFKTPADQQRARNLKDRQVLGQLSEYHYETSSMPKKSSISLRKSVHMYHSTKKTVQEFHLLSLSALIILSNILCAIFQDKNFKVNRRIWILVISTICPFYIAVFVPTKLPRCRDPFLSTVFIHQIRFYQRF